MSTDVKFQCRCDCRSWRQPPIVDDRTRATCRGSDRRRVTQLEGIQHDKHGSWDHSFERTMVTLLHLIDKGVQRNICGQATPSPPTRKTSRDTHEDSPSEGVM